MKNINKYLIWSFVFAFCFSLVSLVYLYPEILKVFYTDNLANLPMLTPTFFVKVFLTLTGQTTLLWTVFYIIAKKIF